jgi:hypothetical protein
MKADLRALILADVQIAALCSVDWVARGQGVTGPALVLTQISGAEGVTQSGPDGVFSGRVQGDCYAELYSDADAMREHLVRVLSGHRAGRFLGIFHVATREGRETEAEREFRISLDFMVHHRSE